MKYSACIIIMQVDILIILGEVSKSGTLAKMGQISFWCSAQFKLKKHTDKNGWS